MRNTKLTVEVAKNIFRNMDLFHLSECRSKNNQVVFKIEGDVYSISDSHNMNLTGSKTEVYAQLLENQLKRASRKGEIHQMVKLINNEMSLIIYLNKNRMRGFVGEDTLFSYSNETRRIYGLTSKEEVLSKEVEQDNDSFKEIDLMIFRGGYID